MKWIALLVPVVLAVVAALSDVIQPFIAANPTIAALIGAVGAVVALLMKSPIKPKE